MAAQTILPAGSYNGPHSGGPFTVPAGTSSISIDASITAAPAGANFRFEIQTSQDGGATWQSRGVFTLAGGSVIPKGGTVPQPWSANTSMTVNLDPSLSYLAQYTENSDVAVTLSATITLS